MQYFNLLTLYNNRTYYYIEQNLSNELDSGKRNLYNFNHYNLANRLLDLVDS
jgi:hypothetical protein